MIEKARQIIKKRLFTTTKDYNSLPDGIDYPEQVAADNRKNLTEEQRQKAIDRLTAKLDKAHQRTVDRMCLGRSRGGSAGALNRDVHNPGFASDEIKRQIEVLKSHQ